MTTMNVADLEVCDRTRVRKKTKPVPKGEIVQEYAESYKAGLLLEPLDVFQESGTERFIVADGEHRLLALRRAGIKKADVRLHAGDELAALDFAISQNQTHGVRLTKEDRYHMFCRIMDTDLKEKYPNDTDLSEKLGVSRRTIASYRADWRNSSGGNKRAKQKAKNDAAKTTPKRQANGGQKSTRVEDLQPPKQMKNKGKSGNGSSKTQSQKASTAKHDEGWTKADDQSVEALTAALSALGKAWQESTRNGQIHMRDLIRDTLRELI